MRKILNLIFIVTISFVLYLKLGILPQLFDDSPVQLGEHAVPKKVLPMMVMNVEKTLLTQPDNQEAWYVLGRLCLLNGEFSCASKAFAKVRELEK